MNLLKKFSYIPLKNLITNKPSFQRNYQIQIIRLGSYYASQFLVDLDEISTKYESTKNPEDWKYVERILPQITVPEPIKKAEYPSGWKPQGQNFQNQPYFIARTKNHMLPVYLRIRKKGTVRQTFIKKIQGDIWDLERELKPFLEDLVKPKALRYQINEFAGSILINGDHVNAIKYWLEQRNY